MQKISIPWKAVKRHLKQFFTQKYKMFRENEIMKLPGKWQKVVEQNDEYVVQ